ncbi:MAG: GntR family transcriptional regulator [Salinibacterium sp.]|nr:GntR family transcriptional regulator [Salinibacterium sp.]
MFTIDHDSTVTLYEQLRSQIIEQVASGELIVGTKLPPVRQLATELGVAPYTAARVYRLLEQDGFLETRGRNGTVVSAREDTAVSMLQLEASQYAARARELGIPAETALDYVRVALHG